MEIKVDPFIMTCIWMAQFPSFYLKSYLDCKNIGPHLFVLRTRGYINFMQAMNVLDYAKENNLT